MSTILLKCVLIYYQVLPFDMYTWALIGFTFAAAVNAVFFVSLTATRTKNFVFGSKVTTPFLNIAHVFFGLGQTVLPQRNFARFILMMFIIYCLIIRTAWQGMVSFESMNKEQIEDVNDDDFEFRCLSI
jgi:hypothetical protein